MELAIFGRIKRKDMTEIVVVLAIVTVIAVIWLIVEKYKYRKIYYKLNQIMDDILEQRKIEISDLEEGELSAFAGKAKRIQEKIELEVDSAKTEKDQIKSLISNLSHQLKTPLSNVMMYRELLEEELPKEQRRQFLRKMQVQLNKIDWILQSLFKMVRLEQGAIQFEIEPQGIRDTILGAVNTVYEKAEQKQILIVTDLFKDMLLYHNRKWTMEVLSNVLENAVKYSKEQTQIKIEVYPLELFTEIRITDQGIGIKKAEQTEIFKRFYRSKEVEQKEGSGIGLYLCRLILEQENGHLTVASEYGKGSSFSVFLQNCQKLEESL